MPVRKSPQKVLPYYVSYRRAYQSIAKKMEGGPMKLSTATTVIMDDMMADIFLRLVHNAIDLMERNKRRTLQPRDIEFAVKLAFPHHLAVYANKRAQKAWRKYNSSRQGSKGGSVGSGDDQGSSAGSGEGSPSGSVKTKGSSGPAYNDFQSNLQSYMHSSPVPSIAQNSSTSRSSSSSLQSPPDPHIQEIRHRTVQPSNLLERAGPNNDPVIPPSPHRVTIDPVPDVPGDSTDSSEELRLRQPNNRRLASLMFCIPHSIFRRRFNSEF